jgi:hypothetical protein
LSAEPCKALRGHILAWECRCSGSRVESPQTSPTLAAPAVVVTLWSVNDTATGHLMKAFYANLNRGMAKDAALRTATLSLLTSPHASGRNPYFWAPFVLIGER